MGLYTIDDYYDTAFYNQTKEALKNNGVEFKEYISTKPPYHFYIECDDKPSFINYDESTNSYARWLVNLVRPLKPSDAYIYERRDTHSNTKAVEHYAINDAMLAVKKSGQGVFFTAEKDQILRVSKEYPRKIYFFGKHFYNKYKLFLADNLIIKNLINPDQVLIESSSFKSVTELEVDLNFNVFRLKDRLVKISETPYVHKGRYYPVSSVVPEISGRYVLS
jgi:hypothetical protein